jgi:hypothetical protein
MEGRLTREGLAGSLKTEKKGIYISDCANFFQYKGVTIYQALIATGRDLREYAI